jgi:hypothetical protein
MECGRLVPTVVVDIAVIDAFVEVVEDVKVCVVEFDKILACKYVLDN